MKIRLAVFVALPIALCALWMGCAAGRAPSAPLAPSPANSPGEKAVVFSTTRQINALTLDKNGALWVATAGGVLRRDTDGAWRKWTRAHGLPSHEISRIVVDGKSVRAQTPHGFALLDGDVWRATVSSESAQNKSMQSENQTGVARVIWRGETARGHHDLRLGEGDAERVFPLPPGRGSHISALAVQGESLWAALYGDGVWSFDGTKWQRLDWKIPPAAREVTALAGKEGDVWLGTRQDGVWHFDGRAWTQHQQDNEPFDANIQNMAAFGDQLWCSTLESGIARFDGRAWHHVAAPQISSNAPRQLVRFAGALWVRHGGGVVDSWDGAAWKRNALPALPRGKAFALAADETRLYAGQWGGWSEWDGGAWTHNLRLPELQGVIILALLPDGDNLWIGTQNRGLGFFNRAEGTVTWHDERAGLPDDWITVAAKIGETFYAGTFVGGLVEKSENGTRWTNVPQLRGKNITALQSDTNGDVVVTTRGGVWQRRAATGEWMSLDRDLRGDSEAQSLCAAPDGMWIGTRTAIYFVRHHPD